MVFWWFELMVSPITIPALSNPLCFRSWFLFNTRKSCTNNICMFSFESFCSGFCISNFCFLNSFLCTNGNSNLFARGSFIKRFFRCFLFTFGVCSNPQNHYLFVAIYFCVTIFTTLSINHSLVSIFTLWWTAGLAQFWSLKS